MTAPEPSAPSETFRESFLRRFERVDHQATVRAFGELLHDLVMEGSAVVDSGQPSKADFLRLRIASVVGDVRQAHEALAGTYYLLEDPDGKEGARLLLAVADAAEEVGQLVARLDAALARYVAAPAGE